MATATKVALPPEKEAGRPNRISGRPTSNLIFNGDDEHTASSLRAQLLRSKNVPEMRLGLLASLIWEARHG